MPLLELKCVVRCGSYSSPNNSISQDLLTQLWAQQLLPFEPDAPPAVEFLP